MRLPISMRFLACLVAATAVLGAQRTWIVDAQMRPGADFPELRLATLVAADGDRILVLPGRYASCSIVRKGLTIVGLPGAEVRSGISGEPAFWAVEVQATQKVSVRGFRIEPQPGGNVAGVFVEGCRGPVHLESLSIGPMEVGLTITRSVAVSVLDVDVAGGVANTIHDSDATLTRCRFVDHAGASGGLAVHSGKASLVDCTVRGYDAIPTLNPASALYCIRSVVTVSGGTYTAGTGSGSRAVPTAAISLSAAELVLDPATALRPSHGGPDIDNQGSVVHRRSVARLVPDPADDVAGVRAVLHAQPGDLAFTLASAPTSPTPTPFGLLWLDPSAFLVVDGGTVGSSGRRTIALPGRGTLGAPLVLQTVRLDASGATSLAPGLIVTY